ncbi:MAG: zinc-dependent metalloprotease [Cytophagales bacterium]|nr:zinc-dependent metalloprotease [Armatimonadota bacterium]
MSLRPSLLPMHPFPTLCLSSAVLSLMLGTRVGAQAPAQSKTAAPAAATATAAEKFTLAYKAQVGQTKLIRGEAVFNMTMAGSKLALTNKQVSKITYTAIASNGDITFEDVTQSSEAMVNGRALPNDDKNDTDTITIHPDGTLVSYKSGGTDKDEDRLGPRLYTATTPVFPKKPLTAGDKWSHDYLPNNDLGTRKAHADYEVLGAEKVGAIDTVKVKMTYAEDGPTPNITGSGTIWVEKLSGDPLRTEYTVDGVPFGPAEQKAIASGTLAETRTEGGPLLASKTAPGSATASKDKTVDEVVKDFTKLPGIVTLYRKKDATKDTIYAELREDQIGKLMMLETTASTGTAGQVVTGNPIDDLVFKFTRTDDRIVMTVPNFRYRTSDPKSPTAKALRRSFAEAQIQSFKIEAKQASRKTVLIDVSELFKSDIAQVSRIFSSGPIPGLGGGGGYSIDREKTFVASVKNFPENVLVSTQYNFIKAGAASFSAANETLADPRSAVIVVSYNLFALPNDPVTFAPTNGFKPRLYDPRVGYFSGVFGIGPSFESFDPEKDTKSDPNTYYIYRWDLKKKDPTAALSAPVAPIEFWLDNAIPEQYRAPIREGVLLWNKTFEKLGFTEAIVVKQMPDDADWDPADMRHNIVRWVTSPYDGGAYAVAQARPNPLTGQVLNASILVDANWGRVINSEHKTLVDPAQAFEAGAGIPVEMAMLAHEARKRAGGAAADSHTHHRGGRISGSFADCEIGGDAMQEQAWFGSLAMEFAAAPSRTGVPGVRIDRKAFVDQFLREVVAHEMGHILGLRHNFAASTELSLAQLKDPRTVQNGGTTASLMDYTPFNIAALRQKDVPFFSQTPGSYDSWAIKYGYTDVPGATTPESEQSALRKIASQSTVKGHAYASDESADQFDPLVTRYDLSSDPIAYWKRTMEVSRYLLVNLDKRLPENGESYWQFTQAFNRLLGTYSRAAGTASRYVGGLNISRSHKGDSNAKAPLQPVDVVKQKQSLALLNTYVFSPGALRFPQRYYTNLTGNPYEFGNSAAPIQDQVAGLQRTALQRLFSASVLSRVANNEYKMGGDPNKALTLVTLYNSVSGNVWAEVTGSQNVPTLRRQLQRAYVDTMVDMVTKPSSGVPEDARMLAWDQLRQLKGKLQTAQARPVPSGAYDAYTRIHLQETLAKVTRALNANYTLGGGQSSGPSLLQMLLGGGEGQKPVSGNP